MTLQFEGETVATPPSGLDLIAGSDTGSSDTDNVTAANSHAFQVTGVTSGNTVEIVNVQTGAVIGLAVASGTTVDINTNSLAALGDGTYSLAARQRIGDSISTLSPAITIVQDTTSPDAVAGSAATQANAGRLFETDLISDEEGQGLTYSLISGPDGLTLDPATGLISWTPATTQIGDSVVTFRTEDLAGNSRNETLTLRVQDEPLGGIRLEVTDLNGNVVNSVQVGDDFFLRFYGVDNRSVLNRDGVFAAYADILFNETLVQPEAGTPIAYESGFTTVQSGTFQTGLIDELGAASNRLEATDEAESLIATIRMEAIAAGTVNIRSEPADSDALEFLLYGNDNEIEADSVAFGSVTLTIGQSFTTVSDSLTVAEDAGATTVDVLQNDVVNSGNATLSVVSVTQPNNGTAAVENGSVVFTPDADFNGTTEFTYRVTDGATQADETVTVTVSAVNDPPTVVDDQLTVRQDTSANRLDVLANDSIAPDAGETLSVTAANSSTTGATVTVSSDGLAVLYTPPAGFVGSDTFTYTVSDGTTTSGGTVEVTVESSDAPPTANPDTFTVAEDSAEATFNVTANDTSDSDNQSFVIESVGTPDQGGSVSISGDGSQILYTPAADFFGTESVSYTIRDTGGGFATTTVTFTVTGVNDPPPVLTTTVGVGRGTTDQVVVRVSDLPANIDGSAEALTLGGLGTPTAGGSVRVDSATGNILYTPPSTTFTGQDSFTYAVDDGLTTSAGTITVDVQDLTVRNILIAANANDFTRDLNYRLLGTDALGAAVDRQADVASDGSVQWADVLPGSYEVHVPAVPFLIGGDQPQVIPIESAAEDGDATVTPTLGRLRPEFISIRDWLGSNPQQSILTVVEPGESGVLVSPSAATDTIVSPNVSLDEAGGELRITGQNSAGDDIEVTLPASADSRVQNRGQIGDMRLFRVSVESDDVSFQVTSSNTANASAEGESVSSAIDSSAGQVDASPLESTSQPEGELLGSVSRSDIFVPVAAGAGTSDSVVLPLSGGDIWTENGGQTLEKTEKITGNSKDLAIADVADELPVSGLDIDEFAGAEAAADPDAVDVLLSSEQDDAV